MKALIFEKPFKIELEEIQNPSINNNEILVEVAYCGVCGTDLHIYEGQVPFVKYPLVPGHELSGKIIQIGSEVKNYLVGDRVALNPNLSCLNYNIKPSQYCYYCKKKRPHFCLNWKALGVTEPGGFAELIKSPASAAIKIPSKVTLKEALFMEPIACCLHGLNNLKNSIVETAAVIGAGPIGLMMISLIKYLFKSELFVFEPIELRRELAIKFGADQVVNPMEFSMIDFISKQTANNGVDLSVEAVGSAQTSIGSIKILNRGGQALLFGVANPSTEIPLDIFKVYENELHIFGSFTNPYENQNAMDILQKNVIDINSLITKQYTLDELKNMFSLMKAGSSNDIKTIVKY